MPEDNRFRLLKDKILELISAYRMLKLENHRLKQGRIELKAEIDAIIKKVEKLKPEESKDGSGE